MTIANQKEDGSFDVTGGYPSGGPYTHEWTGTGTLDGDTVTIELEYYTGNIGYTLSMSGTIADDGSMSGDAWNSYQSATWSTSSGTATLGGVWYAADGTRLARQSGEDLW